MDYDIKSAELPVTCGLAGRKMCSQGCASPLNVEIPIKRELAAHHWPFHHNLGHPLLVLVVEFIWFLNV